MSKVLKLGMWLVEFVGDHLCNSLVFVVSCTPWILLEFPGKAIENGTVWIFLEFSIAQKRIFQTLIIFRIFDRFPGKFEKNPRGARHYKDQGIAQMHR